MDISEAALETEETVDSKEQEKHKKFACTLCSCTLNSETQAQSHSSGVRHLKQLERHRLPLPAAVSRDMLLRHQRKFQQTGPAGRQITYPTGVCSLSLSTAQFSACEIAADEKRVLMCQLCGIGFNSPKQAESHYIGQKHQSRAQLRAAPMSLVPIRTCRLDHDVARPYSNDFLHPNSLFLSFDENHSFNSQDQFVVDSQLLTTEATSAQQAYAAQQGRVTERRPVNDEKPRCDICNRAFNSNSQALAHFHGKSHNEEVVRRANCTLILQNSRSHKKKEQESAAGSDSRDVAGQSESLVLNDVNSSDMQPS